MKRLALLLLLALPSLGEGQVILNVESLSGNVVEGFHGALSGNLRLATGNTDLTQVGGALGIGFLGERNWIRGFAGLDRMEQKDKDILNNRYFHLRYNYRISPRFRTFHFFQLQSNENLLLDRRLLLGSGLRYSILEEAHGRLDLGTGLMYESERLNPNKLGPGEEPDSDVVRMSNLVVGSGVFGEGRKWVTVVYYQPNVENFRDYRLSGEAGIQVALIGSLQLDVALTWRHDSRAPAELDEDDLGFRTGFTYRIR